MRPTEFQIWIIVGVLLIALLVIFGVLTNP